MNCLFAKIDQVFSLKKILEKSPGILSVRKSGSHDCSIWYDICTFLYWTVVDAILEQSLYYFLPDMVTCLSLLNFHCWVYKKVLTQ